MNEFDLEKYGGHCLFEGMGEGIQRTDPEFFEKYKTLQIVLRHTVFNEREAAEYCRCSLESIRYHAIRTKKLPCLRFTKEGLVFLKDDLDSFLRAVRAENYRDHQ